MKKASGWYLFSLSYLSYAAIYIARLNLTVASPVMQREQLMSPSQIGMMGGFFFFFYSMGQLLNGYLGDIASPRKMVITGLVITAASNIAIGFLPAPGIIILLWGVNGFSQSMLWGPLLRAIASRFPPQRQPFIASLLVSSVGVGSILGILVATYAIYYSDIPYAFLIPGILNLVAASLVFAGFRPEAGKKRSGNLSAKSVLRSPKLWVLLLPAMFHGVLKDNINLWAASYFMDTFSIDLMGISFFVFAIPVLSLAGRLLYPVLFRLSGSREHLVSVLALSLCSVCLVLLCNPNISLPGAAVSLSMTAAAISVVNTSFLTIYPTRYADRGCVSKVVGLMDFATYLGAGISSTLYGFLFEHSSYTYMFFSWLVLAIMAIIILILYMKREKKNEE